ncbi:MAG: Ig-like domain-containing protein [Ruminococcus sp.]|nr:Ig-like domain-containing protein [Ruminococcus sp.]
MITSSEGEKSARCVLTVKPGAPTGVTPPFATIEKGKTATLHCTLENVKWYSSNPQVATVSNGLVTAKGVGYATIAAYTDDRASTCLVRVYEPQQPVTQPTTAASTTVAPTTVAPPDPKPTDPDPEPIPTPNPPGQGHRVLGQPPLGRGHRLFHPHHPHEEHGIHLHQRDRLQ